jgi:uncharacterized protein
MVTHANTNEIIQGIRTEAIMDTTDFSGPSLPPVSFPPLQVAPPSTARVWTPFAAFSLSLLVALTLSQFVLAVLARASLLPENRTRQNYERAARLLQDSATGILGSALATCVSFALIALVCASFSNETMGARLRTGRCPWWFGLGLLAALGMMGLGEIFSGIVALLGLEDRGSLAIFARVFAHPSTATLVGVMGIIVLGASTAEELLFRGYIQTRFVQRWGATASVVVSAVMFAVAHFDALHSLYALVAGLLLGWISLRTGTIRVTLVAHAINNLVSMLQLVSSNVDVATSKTRAVGGIVVGAICALLCIAGFWRVDPADAE